MKYNNETPKFILDEYVKHNDERWSQLNDLILSVITDGVKYLFLVNAGGAVAILTFIGTSPDVRGLGWPWVALAFLLVGLIFVGVLHFARYHVIGYLLNNWTHDVVKFYEGKTEYDDLVNADGKRIKKTEWILIFAYLSFLFFILAGACGFIGYKDFIKKEEKVANKQIRQNVISDQKNHIPRPAPVAPTPQPPKK